MGGSSFSHREGNTVVSYIEKNSFMEMAGADILGRSRYIRHGGRESSSWTSNNNKAAYEIFRRLVKFPFIDRRFLDLVCLTFACVCVCVCLSADVCLLARVYLI